MKNEMVALWATIVFNNDFGDFERVGDPEIAIKIHKINVISKRLRLTQPHLKIKDLVQSCFKSLKNMQKRGFSSTSCNLLAQRPQPNQNRNRCFGALLGPFLFATYADLMIYLFENVPRFSKIKGYSL